MDNHESIDAAILTSLSPSWSKTAMVIARSKSTLDANGVAAEYEAITEHVYGLAEQGAFDVAGDIENWRHSELRLAR